MGRAANHPLKAIRLKRGLSLRQLARLSGISWMTIWRIEQGKTEPTVATLRKLAQALNVAIVDLLD